MTTMRRVLAAAAVALAAGCGNITPEGLPNPIEVSGKVTLSNGSPVRNAILHLQPTGKGQQAHYVLGADGSFRGSVTPGEYTYYLAPPRGESLGGVPEKFLQGSLDRQIKIRSGDTSLDIRLE